MRRLALAGAASVVCLIAAVCFYAFGGGVEAARKIERQTPFSTLMAEEALPPERLPKMVQGHPRLLLRPVPWKGGLSLEQLRERAGTEPWAKWTAKAAKTPPKEAGYTIWRALLYLATKDESLVPMIVERIMAAKPAYNCGGGLVQTAIWYDWIYNSPSVTDEQRKKMADHIANVALECTRS